MASTTSSYESKSIANHNKNAENAMTCILPGFDNTVDYRLMSVEVDLEQREKLRTLLAEDENSDLVQAAWALVLRVYTGQNDVCFAYGEMQQFQAVEEMRFARVMVNEGDSFQRFLCNSPERVEYPLLDETHKDLFNTSLFILMQSRAQTSSDTLLASSNPQLTRFSVEILVLDDELKIFFAWQGSYATQAYVLSIASTFDKVLGQLIASPNTPITDLEYLSDRGKKEIWNWNSAPLERVASCIHDIIHDCALAQPNAEALSSTDESLSYRELDLYSASLASYLIAQGVERGDFVPLLFDKSVWNVVAMLSVLKAGAAFVPLDPLAPITRIQTLVQSVNAKVVLCSQHHAITLSSVAKSVIPVNGTMISQQPPVEYELPQVSSTDLAYLIWTSGSTGEPKGTMIEHGSYCSGVKSHAPAMLMSSESRVLQFASHTFDASLVEIMTTLMVGGVVCIPGEEERLNNITTTMQNLGVNWAVLTPSFVGLIDPTEVPGLKTLVMAGEAMSQTHVEKWAHINLVNGYGPSEASVAAVVQSHVNFGMSPTNIGHPTGVHLWVTDPDNHLRLVPIGCVGELLIQGPTIACGYLNQHQKTSEAFIPEPEFMRELTDEQKTWRVYKTGDLVRQNFDGTLNFIGRKDNQVKVHGQRVELGEIEHHLVADPLVKHGIVLLPKNGPSRNRLVSVVSLSTPMSDHGTALKLAADRIHESDQIRERLLSLLPAYMVPSLVVIVEDLPFLSSGKLDRKQIIKWTENMDDESYRMMVGAANPMNATGCETVNSETDLQHKLRMIWSHVLNLDVDQVDFDRSFMSMGGDSISAIQVKGQCSKMKISLTVQEILRSKSIAQLAQYATTLLSLSSFEETIEENFDLSPIQQLYFKLPNRGQGHFNQSFFLRVSRHIEKESLRSAIETIIQRHSMLRARFSCGKSDGKWQQRITEDVSGSYRLRTHAISQLDRAHPAIADSQTALDVVFGPVFAVDLFQVERSSQLLFLVGHHLVIDLVSWRVILEDLEELLSNASNSSIEQPSSFQSWCRLQAEHTQNLAVNTVLPIDHLPTGDAAYWGMLEKPNTYGSVGCKGFEIDQATTSMMLTQCHDALRTEPVDILLSSLIHSFSLTFADRAVPIIYNEAHGREPSGMPIDISRTVGWFTAMYPVHVPESASKDLLDSVRHVKDLRRRLPDNGRSYFATRFLTDEGRARFGHHWPLEVTFNYLGQYQQLERQGALLTPADAMAGETRGAGGIADVGLETPRFGLFEISAVIAQGRLRFSFTFSRDMKHQDRILDWISSCEKTIILMVQRLTDMKSEVTPSDFPLLCLTHDDLRTTIPARLEQIGVTSFEEVEDIYPCSSMQEGLLISQSKSSAFYAVRVISELVSAEDELLSGLRLSQAWQQVVDRHASLRTIFVQSCSTEHGLYDQVVLKKCTADIIHMNCSSGSYAVRKLSHETTNIEEWRPPHRFTICETSDRKLICKLEISHAIMDGASMSIIFRDLALACEGSLTTEPKPLYSDYISFLQQRPAETSIEYWKTYLTDVEPCILPVLNDGVSEASRLKSLRLNFGHPEYATLQTFCNTRGWTLSNVLHMAWGLTLRCYTSSNDPCFGYLVSGRNSPVSGIEDAVGPFINMLVCRIKMVPKSRLGALLDQVQKDYVEGLPHSTASLAEVQHVLRLSGTPLFNTALSFRRLPNNQNSKETKVSFTECVPIYDPTEYNVSVNIEASEENILIDLDYWTDHMSPGQASNVGNAFLQALYQIIDHPDSLIEDLSLFHPEHVRQVLGWNGDMPEALNDCVHKVIQKQAYLQPNRPAICAWDSEFTYAELDSLTTQLAQYLVGLNVRPEVFVPTCFDKSAWTIVAMLGVLKAGGAAVPLDATHPINALEMRVRDTGAKVVLASPDRANLFEDMGVAVICISREAMDALPRHDQLQREATALPDNPCFVIYTSGSTGKPKGVVLEHRSIVTSGHATGTVYGLGPQSRVLQFAAYTFDNSLAEIFITLMRGGCVCVPSEHDRLNDLAGAINKLAVNFVDITPTVASFLGPSDVPHLKGLSLGGEALTREVIETWGSAVSLHCCYGPSECSINSTWNGNLRSSEATNIGKSIGSVSWIVEPDNHDNLVPIGGVGELLIEGPILAREYLNDAGKTAKSFIRSPKWAPRGQRRMYKTGDLARYNSNGTITYLGRKDTQVKLNGQRIELGEIEHHLKSNLPADSQSAVELISYKNNNKNTKALAAFFCLQNDGSVPVAGLDQFLLPMSESATTTCTELETYLAGLVPAYMVPKLYIPLKTMPTTSSGKLDRKRLRECCNSLSEEQVSKYRLARKSGRLPSSKMEILLAQLWESVLDLEPSTVGLDDNFFRLGGDSVAAIKLISVSRAKGVHLTVSNIFKKPILLDQARDPVLSVIDASCTDDTSVEPFSLIRGYPVKHLIEEVSSHCRVHIDSIQDMYPCTAIQEGLIALSNKDPGAYVAQNIYRLPSDVDISRFKQAWDNIIEAEIILRTRVVFTESCGFLQVVVREPIFWHHLTDLQDIAQQPRTLPAYNGGELAMYSIVEECGHRPTFIWTAHHALYDGWCIPLMLQRVEACYRNLSSVDNVIGAAYPRFIRYLSEISADESDNFWKTQLSGTTAVQFPVLPHPSYQVHATSSSTHTIHVRRGSATHITLPSTIRAAWALVVATYSGSEDVVFGETLTGRDAPVSDITNIIGPTLATVPTRISIDSQNTIAQFLAYVQDQSAETIPFQHAGLQRIKYLSGDASIASQFQTLLAIHHESADSSNEFWDLRSSGTVGTNFYSYPLTVSCQVSDGKLDVEARYDQGVISAWLIDKMLIEFDFLVQRCNSPEMMNERVGKMELLNARDEISIRDWNSGPLHVIDYCIHHLIQKMAEEQPDSKTAVDSWDATFTYRELVSLSTKLARNLLEKDVRGTLIPLCFEKSAWTIVAMLAILMSGATIVPLDPGASTSRLQAILEDTRAQLILCSLRYRELCLKLVPEAIVVQHETIAIIPNDMANLPPVDPDSPAYVIFTSGTTGKPKGTTVRHNAFCSGAASHGPALKMDSSSRVLQFASYAFDASLLEILTTLTLGGCVCVPSEDARMNNITEFIKERNVSWTLLTPSFVQTIQPSAVPTLRTLVLGGEAMAHTHLSTWADKLELINAYGPSEASVVATASDRLSLTSDPMNIGRAVGSHSWVADVSNPSRLVPIGAQGELIIEGPILSSGYLNNQERTASAFIDPPNWVCPTYGGASQKKLYRTGDVVKYSPNGELIYCGRKDTQTKLHGQRLELGEVEHHLRTDPFVQHIMAVVPKNGPCSKRLVVVLSLQEVAVTNPKIPGIRIVAREASSFYLSAIRERLCDKLSASTMPSNWVILQSLPLLPSGKLDRRQIERWVEDMNSQIYQQISDITGERRIVEGTNIEKQLQEILGAVLNLPKESVGLHQSFIHLGGDSLSAMQVMSRCRAEGLGVSVQDIIQSRSISQLALRVVLPEEFEEVEATDEYFDLSPMQHLFFECVGISPNHFNQSVLLRLGHREAPEDIEKAIKTIINGHPMLRARFSQTEAGIWQQSISVDISASFRCQTRTIKANQISSLVQDSQQSLDIQKGPLLAINIFDVEGEKNQILSIVAHHLVIDVVSWRIILQDLEDILQEGKPKLQSTISFQNWSRLQAEHTQKTIAPAYTYLEDVPVADFGYWGMEDEPNTYADAIEDGFQLDSETSLLLLGNCHEPLQTETVDLLLASVLQSFHKVFKERSAPSIFNEGHGREAWENSKVDLSRTVGWFTTMCPIYLPSISDDPDLLNTIRWVKDLRRRIPNKGRPYFAYRMLTEEGQERFSSHWPMEITFNYLGKMQQLERKDALFIPVDDINTNRFDIGGNVPRFALFEISAFVTNGAIKMIFSYNRHMRRQAKIGRWVAECQKCLQDSAKRLLQMNPERTLSEFPLLPLAYNGISKLVGLLPQLGVHSVEEIEDVYPCSPVQQGMLLAQLKNPSLYAYSSVLEVRSLDGHRVNLHVLAEAWQATVRKHSTLRTVFISSICQKGLNDQVVLRDIVARVSWLECDDAHALETFEQQKPTCFVDFQPPHRLTLCKTDRDRVFCRLEISHAISDGTSMPILLRDFALAYTRIASRVADASLLAKVHVIDSQEDLSVGPPYSQYISYIQSKSPDIDINYWKAYLAGIEPCHLESLNEEVKVDKTLRTLILPLTHTSDLESFCSKNGFTMSNILQFVWALVLRTYVGTDEVVFGYLTSGRDAPVQGLQNAAVGTFINMLTCRLHLTKITPMMEALSKIQADFVKGMAHQSCSLADIQHELQLSTKSLFNTAFTFQKRTDDQAGSVSSVPVISFNVLDAHDPNEYDVTVNIEATSSAIEVHLGYWTTCLSDAQAMNICHTFQHILNEIVLPEQPCKLVGDLDPFSDHSRQQVMHWNAALPDTVDRCIHDMVHDQRIRQRRNAPAVCAWDENFTYAELDDLAMTLALHLIELGVGPETYVPLCFQKSAWMVVSMLAVLRAGGAFVPLDHTQPQKRLKNFIDDVQANVVLCSHENLGKMSVSSKHVVVVNMKLIRELNYNAASFMPSNVSPDNSAYIIFTSGTTGRPKGTIIEHAAFCTSAVEHARAMGMTSSSRVLQFASHTFDASVMELLTTLVVGGCICIPSEEDRMNNIPGVIKAMRVTWTLLTPSVTNTLSPKSVPNLKVLVTGGEKMSLGHIEKWKNHCCVINAYGPSETSVIASVGWKVDKNRNELNADPSNIGQAVGGRAWILDPNDYNKLVPVGAIGELAIEGRTVARGYLNNDQKTSEAFISNPEWLHNFEKKQRVYRTGDLVRYNSDGSLMFVARKDTQIKLNGQRIELGEIEHNVKIILPDKCQSAVELVAPMNRVATKALAVFLTHPDNHNSPPEDVRVSGVDEILLPMSEMTRQIAKHLDSSLAGSLPTYMIPAFYVPVRKMPWTSSGKLDRVRLRNILQNLPIEIIDQFRPTYSNEKSLVIATNAMEKKLQRLWENVLNVEPPQSVGSEDSFFRLGGDSVAAMKLVGLARSEAISLTVIDIFKNPRLCDMTLACTSLAEKQEAELEPFSLLQLGDPLDDTIDEIIHQCQVDREMVLDAYPCSLLQEGLITLSTKQDGAYVIRNIFKLPKDLDVGLFRSVWEKTVADLDILRTRIVHLRSSDFVQVVLQNDPIKWETVETLEDIENDDAPIPAHNGGALTRYAIVHGGDAGNKYFIWHIHHALYDGWSLPMVLHRVEKAYYNGSSLPPPKAPFSTFIQYLKQADGSASKYWRTNLAGASPMQFPQPQSLAPDHQRKNSMLKHTSHISRSAASMGVTVATVIRAAWAVVVAAYSGSHDVVFGETMAGRNIPVRGIEDIVGPTIATVPTRIRIDRGHTAAHFLQHVQKIATQVIPYQHIGLQRIKRLSSDSELACDFQNLLVIQTVEEEIESKLWDLQHNEMASNFFTYPLVLECRGYLDKVEITAHYDEFVLSGWQMQRILYQFEAVLKQFSDLPKLGINTRLDAIEIFSPQDRELVQKWTSTTPQVVNACIHEEFEDKSLSQPQAQAVHAWDGDFTYQELRDHATCLAYHLIKYGVGPEVFVPICMEKSAWAIVGIMGVLMAGGAFVPLDPLSPQARHQEMIKDVRARLVLCSPHHKDRFVGLVDKVLPIDEDLLIKLLTASTPTQEIHRASSRNAAYVIFTSGSTGRPKGTVIEHRAISTSSMAMRKSLMMSATARVFQFASFTFDVSVLETLTTLTCGGCICIPSEDMRTRNVGEAIHSLQATWSFLTPSVASLVDPSTVPSLEVLVCGGEPMSQEIVHQWASKVKLINGYGPTEASVISISNSLVNEQRDPSNIGFALSSGCAWIADSQDHTLIAPVGCIGELLLSGPFLAREYINSSVKTEEAFVKCPPWAGTFHHSASNSNTSIHVTPNQPDRMYKTGDLVRYNEDGSMVFVGRKDHQVKLHGQRLELGEIEHLLDEDPEIQHAVVSLPKNGPFRHRLVAVASLNALASLELTRSACKLVLEGPQAAVSRPQILDAQRRLCDLLPPYMIPSSWLVVESVPLLESGKLDKRSVETWLQSIDDETYERILEADDGAEDETLATATCRTIQQIISRVLNLPIEKVKLSKSFMSLGGDSITSMQVMAHCRKESINLSLMDVLKSKSIQELAAVARCEDQVQHEEEIQDQDFDLSPIQCLYFQSQRAENFQAEARFNQSFSLEVTRHIDSEDLRSAIQRIVSNHSMLRARFRKNPSGIWKQRVIQGAALDNFQVHHVEHEAEIPLLVKRIQSTLDINDGPVFIATLFNVGEGRQMIFLVAHHLVIDMVSWRIILEDLEENLNGGSVNSEKPLSFQAWCSMQQTHSQKLALDENVVTLPFDVPPPDTNYWGLDSLENNYGDVVCETFVVDEGVTSLALGDSNRAFRTEPIELFLAAIAHSFSRVFVDRDIPAVFNETHGREPWDTSIDISRTVGWFTSMFPVYVPIDTDEDDLVETVRRMKDTRRSVPSNGRPNFAHRFLTEEGKEKEKVTIEILFNYLGRMQQLEHDDSLLQQWNYPDNDETSGLISDVGPRTARLALFEISAAVVREKLQFSFLYNSRMKHQRAVEQWIGECHQTFENIVRTLASIKQEPCYTLSDFPLLPISYDGLHKILTVSLPQAGIALDNIEDIYPCAPMQEGLLISQIKNPSLYHVHAIFEVYPAHGDSRVDSDRLAKAWQTVVNRHGALRTIFVDSVSKGDIFNQVVVKKADSGIVMLRCDEAEALEKLNSISILDTNYTKKPRLPHQAFICDTSNGKVYLKAEVNHAIIDGTSANIMLRDLADAYHGRLSDGLGPLFSDYIAYIKRHTTRASIDFWKEYLEGAQACHFPILNKKPPKQRRLSSIDLRFEKFPALQEMCRKMNVTMANVMQAAWAFCLREYTKAEDVAFGYLTSGRDVSVRGVQGTLGAFINILVCRVRFTKRSTIKEVFQKVQNDYLSSLEHQHCSLAQVQHESMSGQALFNTAVSIQSDGPSDGKEKESISFDPVVAHDPSEYPVTLNIRTLRNDEGIVIRYWSDVMAEDQAEDLSAMLERVMNTFINKPNQLVEDLDLSQHQKHAHPQEIPRQATPTAQQENSPLGSTQMVMSGTQLRTIVTECVREVMKEMFSSGSFPGYGQQTTKNIMNAVQQETIHSMIDYSQLSAPPPRPKPTRLPSADTIASIRRLGVEQKLLSVWSELLQISKDSIKKDDSFFTLGGDSIVAMQMVGLARDEDLALTVANIFHHPTFADMAAVIRMAQDAQVQSQSPESIAVARDYLEAHDSRSQAIQNAFYQRYSLLEVHDVNSFLQQNVCPKVRSFRGGIIDVFPVTDFQALAITGALMEAKWMLNYFYLEGDGILDLKTLRTAILRMVNAFDILRTVFTPYCNRFFQVVLRKLHPSISVHETDNLTDFTSELQQKDRKHGPRLGEPYLQFTVARQKGSTRHRIIMRLSHAQYDGVCLPSILNALQSGFGGRSIPDTPAFSTYVRDSARQTTDEHYLYWKDVLKGSSMTDVVRRKGPNYSRGTETPTTLKRVIRMPSLASDGITPATIIKAAWAIVLAQWSAKSDIVFGNVISGRNADVLGVDRIIGPCVNLIPVRVDIQKGWAVLDLLHSIQDQQVAAMPYESLGFREIIKHCTSWPDWTNFSTVCQHQNIQRQTQIPLGNNEYTLGAVGSQEDFADLTILSTPQGGDEIEISLTFTSNSGITLPFATEMFEALCKNSIQFPKDLEANLPSPLDLSALPQRTLEEIVAPRSPKLCLKDGDLTREEVLSYSVTLDRVWRQVLTGQSASIALEASFFEMGGDIVGLAQVASLLEQEGIVLRIEDLIDHPKMIDQLSLIAMQKRKEKESMLAETPVNTVAAEIPENPKRGLRKILDKSLNLARKAKQRRGGERAQ